MTEPEWCKHCGTQLFTDSNHDCAHCHNSEHICQTCGTHDDRCALAGNNNQCPPCHFRIETIRTHEWNYGKWKHVNGAA